MDKDQKTIADHQELADLIGTIARYGTLLIGGLCIFVYSSQIGQFPEGISLGEGLAFYLVCAGFLCAYALYLLICTATGSLLMAYPAQALQRIELSRQSERARHYKRMVLRTDFSSMRDGSVVSLGVMGLLFYVALIYFSKQRWEAALWLLPPLLQGTFVMFYLVVTRRLEHLQSGLVAAEHSEDEVARGLRNAVTARRFFIVALVALPLMLTPERFFLFEAAFRVAQLRKDRATVHVKLPWADRVAKSSLSKAPSFLGPEYVEFKKVNVLLRSVGQKVVIELPEKEGTSKLSIPADAIHIE